MTNILDERQADALELAALYHERWEIEGLFDEFKTHLRPNTTVLRGKTPELVQQELWGLLLAHFAIRQPMTQAAWQHGLDPDRLSFVHAVRVLKRKMPQAAAIPLRAERAGLRRSCRKLRPGAPPAAEAA